MNDNSSPVKRKLLPLSVSTFPKLINPIPDIFLSAEEAGEFWDNHSTGDYEAHLIPVDMTINIKRRHFEIEIDRESFMALNAYSKKVNKQKLISPSPLG